MVRPILRWAPVVAWAAVIFAFSAQPGSAIPSGYSEVGHFSEYAIFGGLLVAALWPQMWSAGASVATAVLIASAYGITDELHQFFVPGRTPDVADWSVDTLGALVGAFVVMLLLTWLAGRRNGGSRTAGRARQ